MIEKDDYIRLLDGQIKKSHNINCREGADQAFTDEVNYYYSSYYYKQHSQQLNKKSFQLYYEVPKYYHLYVFQ